MKCSYTFGTNSLYIQFQYCSIYKLSEKLTMKFTQFLVETKSLHIEQKSGLQGPTTKQNLNITEIYICQHDGHYHAYVQGFHLVYVKYPLLFTRFTRIVAISPET